jgi:hypothetical protein
MQHRQHRLKQLFIATSLACLAVSAVSAHAASSGTPFRPVSNSVDKVTTTTESWVGTTEFGADMIGNSDIVIAQAPAERHGSASRNKTLSLSLGDLGIEEFTYDILRSIPGSSGGGAAMFSVKSIKNAPYSAEVIYERTQTLPDGNVIEKRTRSSVFRDSAGRIRQESKDGQGGTTRATVNDPVDGTGFSLSPASKVATKYAKRVSLDKRIEELRAKAKSIARSSTGTTVVHGGPGEEVIIKRIETPSASGEKVVEEKISVNVIRVGAGPSGTAPGSAASGNTGATVNGQSAADARLKVLRGIDVHAIADSAMREMTTSGTIGNAWKDFAYRKNETTKDLGTKDIDGVRVTGTLKSYSIPAGELGNRNPITVTTERWYSPELQVTMYSKTSDPRTGDAIYRLANVSRSEQPMSLFTIPSDYAVKEPRVIGLGASTESR